MGIADHEYVQLGLTPSQNNRIYMLLFDGDLTSTNIFSPRLQRCYSPLGHNYNRAHPTLPVARSAHALLVLVAATSFTTAPSPPPTPLPLRPRSSCIRLLRIEVHTPRTNLLAHRTHIALHLQAPLLVPRWGAAIDKG
jgi:hypothetical protein